MTAIQLSVVIPAFNGERYLGRALSSICNQDFHDDIEVLVIDDGSTDGTTRVAHSFETRLNVRLIEPAPRHNWAAMANIGLSEARAPWMTVLPQDDSWTRQRHESFITNIDREHKSLIFMQSIFIDADDRVVGRWRIPRYLLKSGDRDVILRSIYVQNWIALPSVTFRVAEAREVGGFREDLWYTADWQLWMNLLKRGRDVQLLKNFGSFFRLHKDSQTNAGSSQVREFRQQLETVQRESVRALQSGRRGRDYVTAGAISTELNVQLVALYHGNWNSRAWLWILRKIGMHPVATRTFVRNSAVRDRILSRARVFLRRAEEH